MKKLGFLLLLLSLAFGSCDDDNTSRIETWTVASEKGVAGIVLSFGYVPAYIVKRGANPDWETMSVDIEGFAFEQGYESVLRVRIEPVAHFVADGPNCRYVQEKVISHTPMQSVVDPLQFSPELEITVASQRADAWIAAYWIKDMRYTQPRWQALPWEIDGFDFKSGYEARIRIQPVAEYKGPDATMTDDSGWRVTYVFRELISSEEKSSEGLPI